MSGARVVVVGPIRRRMHTAAPPLAQSLVRSGVAQTALPNRAWSPTAAPPRGVLWETTAIPEIREQAKRIAERR